MHLCTTSYRLVNMFCEYFLPQSNSIILKCKSTKYGYINSKRCSIIELHAIITDLYITHFENREVTFFLVHTEGFLLFNYAVQKQKKKTSLNGKFCYAITGNFSLLYGVSVKTRSLDYRLSCYFQLRKFFRDFKENRQIENSIKKRKISV